MKNIKSIILFLPALLLTSCGARQITTPDAKKIMQDHDPSGKESS